MISCENIGLKNSDILCIIQSRLGSSRLPAKALLPLGGYPLIILAAKRVQRSGINVVATVPNNSENEILRKCLEKYKIPYFEGPENNLLERFSIVLKKNATKKIIVRISADNFIADSKLIKKNIDELIKRDLFYLSASGKGSGLPIWGTGIEVFKKEAFEEAYLKAKNSLNKAYFMELIKKIYGENVSKKFNSISFSKYRITIDTYNDYIYANYILSKFKNPIKISWKEILLKIKKYPRSIK